MYARGVYLFKAFGFRQSTGVPAAHNTPCSDKLLRQLAAVGRSSRADATVVRNSVNRIGLIERPRLSDLGGGSRRFQDAKELVMERQFGGVAIERGP